MSKAKLLVTIPIVVAIASIGFANAQTTPAAKDKDAPVAGANSFTENQAKDRIQKAGFSEVKGLRKDDQGVWRGSAKKGGKQVNVSVDFRGNVVAQ